MKTIAVIGASGAIGNAFTCALAGRDKDSRIYAFSRSGKVFAQANVISGKIDMADEASIEAAARQASEQAPLDMVIVATGILHQDTIMPEKSLKDIAADNFVRVFHANTLGPALVMKHFLPNLRRQHRGIFAVLSARVGSISDNRLGGWYAYRASKAALNMLIKNASIEMARFHKKMIIIGLHPGTVDSKLSQPFQTHVPPERLFTPASSVEKMLAVIDTLTPADSGKCVAYDGNEIFP